MKKKSLLQDPHSLVESRDGDLEAAIGRQVRALRKKLDMRVTELATLAALSGALNVPVTALFQQFEELHEATFVPAGQGLKIERRGSRSGHEYLLLGHSHDKSLAVEPYMITLTDESDTFPFFQHAGSEFIYMLSGGMSYRHGNRVYTMKPGDSLFFDATVPHGPETLDELPCNFIAVIAYSHGADR